MENLELTAFGDYNRLIKNNNLVRRRALDKYFKNNDIDFSQSKTKSEINEEPTLEQLDRLNKAEWTRKKNTFILKIVWLISTIVVSTALLIVL